MTTAEVQIHGYRKGHQLLASSVILSKDDQTIVDRLSDVAGPLRPKEQFKPYLSAYPLPSGRYYVIARTWQDSTVSRAGCGRTKSIFIDTQTWALRPPLSAALRLLDSCEPPLEADAVEVELNGNYEEPLPPAPNFSASELLEALFLEDAKPVVVFDAPDPELIALRLLTALWPEMRRRFALSTFALSPRKIGGKDLDLVFAPLSAKAKFSDWPGRRVSGRSSQTDRHKWTGAVVRRVFEEPLPKLMSDREMGLLGDRDAGSAASLRIALLWDELLEKLNQTPAAVLGLLDIANSGLVSRAAAVKMLEPRLAEATRRAGDNLAPHDAWDFVGAIVRKIQGQDMPAGMNAIEQLAESLAERAPEGAVSLLQQPDPKGSINDLIPSIAKGLGQGTGPGVAQVLIEAPVDILAHLISQDDTLAKRAAWDDRLIKRIIVVFKEAAPELADSVAIKLLPFLVEDRQISAAIPIFGKLSAEGIVAQLRKLGDANNYQAENLCSVLIDRALKVGAIPAVRDVLVSSAASLRRDALLAETLKPITSDLLWILDETRLSHESSLALLMNVLQRANDRQFAALLSDEVIGERVFARLPDDAIDMLVRALVVGSLPLDTYIRTIWTLLPKVDDTRKFDIARHAMARCLSNRFDGDEGAVLPMLLSILGERLDGRWIATLGLSRDISVEIASRNLVIFEKAPLPARKNIVFAVDVVARTLLERQAIDLTEAAYDACARLMFDSEKTSGQASLVAAGLLTPTLLRARSQPVSLLLAALFPIVYRELAKANDVPDVMKFMSFFDWDRCKAMRRELVYAFMASSWRPGDLALAACRCGDIALILKKVAKSYGGNEYLARIENDLGRLHDKDQQAINRSIAQIRSDKSYKFDW